MAEEKINKNVLLDLNKDFKKSKAEQILRLLKDQECLNEKFREFALESDDSDINTDDETGNLTDSDESIQETERKLAERISLRRHSGVRCKTSMGFHNEAEFDVDSGIESRDPSANPSHRPLRTTNSNPRRRLYTHRTAGVELSVDLGETVNFDDPQIESARYGRPNSVLGSAINRTGLSLHAEHHIYDPRTPVINETYIRRRPRMSSAKIDPLCRKTPIKGFCESRDIFDSRQEDPMFSNHAPLPKRSFTSQTFVPISGPKIEHQPGRLLNRSHTIVDRGVHPSSFVSQSRPFTPVEASLHPRGDCRVLAAGRPRRKLPDIAKAKALTVMKLPPLESNKPVNNRDLLCLSKEPCASDIRC